MSDIKSMGLYRHVDRILADLAATGVTADDSLTVDDLTPFDQYHYEGTDAVDDAAAFLGAGPSSAILDVGSGLGGPARYLAGRTGCRVTALELQPDLHETGKALTQRCGLDHLVTHVDGNVLDGVVPSDSFSGLMSMLCVLHIPDRTGLFAQCAGALQPGGLLFVDDYYEIEPLTAEERAALADKVFCTYLPSLATYVADVESAGFVYVATTDKTADWTAFVVDRLAAFRARRDELEGRYGAETVAALDDFYATVAGLFTNGRLGGVRLTARLPEVVATWPS